MSVLRSQCKDDAEYLEAKRDDFAAAALTGLCALVPKKLDEAPSWGWTMIASASYQVADAMMKERNRD